MRQATLEPVDRNAALRAGWFRRLGNDVVERKLDTAMERLVRQEKYTSAVMVSFRIARELEGPLRSLEQHIAELDRLAGWQPEILQVVASLRQDRDAVLRAIQRLAQIEPPVGTAA